jgi:drug/metabolite transporter (DMT)-like permease
MRNTTALGAAFGTAAGLAWGAQFVVGKSALATVDSFPLTTVRYGVASVLLLALLAAVEGRSALRLGGRGLRLLWLGTIGFAGFNLLAYTGLEHAKPQSAALIVALGPLLTALVLWQRTRIRPSARTFALLGVALAGVALVISGGRPSSLVHGALGWGDVLVLGGVLSFVVYGLGAASVPELSPLRYTALTAALGWPAILLATVVATATGVSHRPSVHAVWSVTPQLAYLIVPGVIVAVVAWNAAIGILGPQNASLFGNLVPITTFVIEAIRGYRPGALELTGAALTIGALVANNLLARRRSRPAVVMASRELAEAA